MNNYKQGTQEYGLEYFRMLRDAKLAETDWMAFPDSPTMSNAWKTYRQSLRDMTTDFTVPLNDKGFVDEDSLVWPTKPE
jgi:hypothetical protein